MKIKDLIKIIFPSRKFNKTVLSSGTVVTQISDREYNSIREEMLEQGYTDYRCNPPVWVLGVKR